MNLTSSPRTPKWPYLLGDAALLGLACLIGVLSPSPISSVALSLIFGCVALGALLAAVPYLLEFLAAQQAEGAALQTKLEAQNNRLHSAVEILASTSGQLKAAHEAAARAVHAADTLPYRLQEKVAEFTTQIQEHNDEEKAAMAKELETLRDAEGQRLTALVATIQTATKDFAAIEREARAGLEAARREATNAAPALAAALGAATTRAEAALNQASALAQQSIAAAEARARETVAAAEAVATRLLERTAALRQVEQELEASLQQRIGELNASARAIEQAAAAAERARLATADRTPSQWAADTEQVEPAAAAATAPALPVMQLTAFPRMKRDLSPMPLVAAPPPPENTVDPTADSIPAVTSAAPESTDAAAEPGNLTAEAAPKREPRRKSTSRSLGEAVLPGFAEPEIVYDAEPTAQSGPAKTSDGTTRLFVTAYIGIGNKVFVRGEGPGLSWEKGIPMEFVSIGKWSWQTADAADPIKVQFFKNDELAAQGEVITVPPGHHVEATPVFREPDPF